MQLVISPGGAIRCVYSEAIDLAALGRPSIVRASSVEPTPDGRWTADMGLLLGPVLGPFDRRSEALAAEQAWLDQHWLNRP
jgi:hypothetical protein